jgi:hypothetical protein
MMQGIVVKHVVKAIRKRHRKAAYFSGFLLYFCTKKEAPISEGRREIYEKEREHA